MRISHEAIYQALFVQGRGALRRELTACLRTGRTLRTPRARVGLRGKSFVSPDIMISQRPAEADDRAVPGHWEGDLILGLGSSAIGTLVERTTRFTMLLHPRAHLASWAGILRADAYGGYGELYRDGREPGPVLETGCFAQPTASRSGMKPADAPLNNRASLFKQTEPPLFPSANLT